MKSFLANWYKNFIKKFDWFVIRYFTNVPVTLSTFLHTLNSRNNSNHIFPIQTKSNGYQIVRICNHRYTLFVLVLFQYDLV